MTYEINMRMQATSPAATWRKSSFCSASSTCVEVAQASSYVAMRDGKDPASAVLEFGAAPWAEFVTAVRLGEFNPSL